MAQKSVNSSNQVWTEYHILLCQFLWNLVVGHLPPCPLLTYLPSMWMSCIKEPLDNLLSFQRCFTNAKIFRLALTVFCKSGLC